MNEIIARSSAWVAAVCIAIYWGAVVVKLFKLARKIGKDPNAMPREPVGQLMRVIWYPTVIVMLTQGILVAAGAEGRLARQVPGLARWIQPVIEPGTGWSAALVVATAICVLGTVYTFVCWRKMGRSWRIGIDPGEKLELVSTGPYRYVRHPIYAIRMVIGLCALVAIPTGVMAVTVGLDILLMQIEARREERYMEATHGKVYADYKKSVGRFVPRSLVV